MKLKSNRNVNEVGSIMSLFKRSIEIEVEEAGNSDIIIKGKLSDHRSSEILHKIEAEMVVSVFDGKIKEIRGSMPVIPMEECRTGIRPLARLMGAEIKPGFTETVRKTVGSSDGCTHLASLITNMGNVSVQGRGAYVRKHYPSLYPGSEGTNKIIEIGIKQLGLLNSCVCWRKDGPIMSGRGKTHGNDEN